MNEVISPGTLAARLDAIAELVIVSDRTMFTAPQVRDAGVRLQRALEGALIDALVITGEHQAINGDGAGRP